jgi:hypothetical protein
MRCRSCNREVALDFAEDNEIEPEDFVEEQGLCVECIADGRE